jgi:hypothetical protein
MAEPLRGLVSATTFCGICEILCSILWCVLAFFYLQELLCDALFREVSGICVENRRA